MCVMTGVHVHSLWASAVLRLGIGAAVKPARRRGPAAAFGRGRHGAHSAVWRALRALKIMKM